jgi:hypothetical protein
MKYIILLLIAFCLFSCNVNSEYTSSVAGVIKNFDFASGRDERHGLVCVTLDNGKTIMLDARQVAGKATGDTVYLVIFADGDRWYTTRRHRD